MEILAAERTESIRETLREVIEVLGHQPVEARDTIEVWDALTSHYPDLALIVIGWDLPGSMGSDLVRRIVSHERYGKIPLMVLFGENEAAHAIEAFQAGATECVSRAATRQDLLTRMLECLGRAA
jgi:two-component system cell cycle response regulator